jgi:hypothetical protein
MKLILAIDGEGEVPLDKFEDAHLNKSSNKKEVIISHHDTGNRVNGKYVLCKRVALDNMPTDL